MISVLHDEKNKERLNDGKTSITTDGTLNDKNLLLLIAGGGSSTVQPIES